MGERLWKVIEGEGPLVAAALHNGHTVREEVAPYLAVSSPDRLREEDAFTGTLTEIAPTRVIALHSRFEVDLNRPADGAIYRGSEEADGLDVWTQKPPSRVREAVMADYHAFYAAMEELLRAKERRHGRFLVLDLHAYNHRRGGPTAEPADPRLNPEINVGTGSMDRERWGPVVDAFLREMQQVDFLGRRLDVRENVRFEGGHFPAWVHRTFPETGCAISVEVKKFFMDEWSGEPEPEQLNALLHALHAAVPAVLEAFEAIDAVQS